MDIFTLLAQAQPAEPPIKGFLSGVFPIIIIFAIFYLVLIRPQQKQQNELRKQIDALKVGDKVLTTGGILGIVMQVKEKIIVVKISDNTRVEMVRSGVQQVMKDDAKDDKKEEKKDA